MLLQSRRATANASFHCSSSLRYRTTLLQLRFLLCALVLCPLSTGFQPLPRSDSYRMSYKQQSTTHTMQRGFTKTPDDAMANSEPLYITVGTQCCGKTTYLKHRLPIPPLDISLDDQPDVYVPVDTCLFLSVSTANDTAAETDQRLLRRYQGKTLMERIQRDNAELKLVLQRFKGDLSPEKFAAAILHHYQHQQYSMSLAKALIDGVEQESSLAKASTTESLLPSHVQVFVLESLFQPHPSTNQSAIQRAHRILQQTPSHIPVAWGNTNSKARDYQMALEIACQSWRPVRFLVQGRDLPQVPLPQILRRNLKRLSQTGKYIPAVAIADCQERIAKLLSDADAAAGNATTDDGDAALALEQYLVQLAEPRGNQYRYRLTRKRLIQKEFRNGAPPGHDQSRRPPPEQVQNKRPRWN